MKKLIAYFGSLWRRLLELRDTPHAIAGGVGIGVFFGFSPLFGVKTLLSLATAWLTRCSKIAAVIAVSLHDVVWPFLPILLRIQYDIGYWILSHPHRLPEKVKLSHSGMKFHAVFDWETYTAALRWLGHGGLPIVIGAFVMAVPLSLIAYTVTYFIVSRRDLKPLRPSS